MSYREPAPDRVAAAARERIAWIASEISRLDAEIGSWARLVPDGTPAPAPAIALMVERERLYDELHLLAARVLGPGAV